MNLILGLLNLDKLGYLPISTGLWNDEAVQADGAATPTESGGGDDEPTEEAPVTDGSDAEAASDETTPTTEMPAQEQSTATSEDVDDWPNGRGPVPVGPPVPRLATIDADGRMTLTGSVPNWATAQALVQIGGSNLPGGPDDVNNQLTWHPEASADIRAGDVLVDSAATFGLGETEIVPPVPILDLAIQVLQSRPSLFVVVVGHTDDVGDEEQNAQIALARAEAVVAYLVEGGVVPTQIVVASAGEDDPTASNETEAGRDANRRIELQFKNFFIPPTDFGSGE